jgi:hypothetical protein
VGQGAQAGLVAGLELFQVGVEAVGEPGALGQQLASVVDQRAQRLQRPVAADGGQVGIAQGDPGDQQRVDRVGLGLAAAPPARLGGELGWDLDHDQTPACRASAAGRPRLPDPQRPRGRAVTQRPADQLGVPDRVVAERGLLDRAAVLVDGTRRQGVLVGVDPDEAHLVLLSARGMACQAVRTRAWAQGGPLLSSDSARRGSRENPQMESHSQAGHVVACVTPGSRPSQTRTSFCSSSSAPASRSSAALLGKIPTTSVRRPSSRLTRSSGLVLRILDQCSRGSW